MTAPADITASAVELGLELIGWDETHGGVRAPQAVGYGPIDFVGTHAEIRAFLHGWVAHHEQRTVRASMIVLRTMRPTSGGVIVTPGQSVQLRGRPSIRGLGFRGQRIAIPEALAPYVSIEEIRVGSRAQYQQVPGEVFSTRIDTGPVFELVHRRPDPNVAENDYVATIEVARPALAEFGAAIDMEVADLESYIGVSVLLHPSAPGPLPITVIILGTLVKLDVEKRPGNALTSPREKAHLLAAWRAIVDGEQPVVNTDLGDE